MKISELSDKKIDKIIDSTIDGVEEILEGELSSLDVEFADIDRVISNVKENIIEILFQALRN